jgi:diguanylate cyclase (GGDEF)-like protein
MVPRLPALRSLSPLTRHALRVGSILAVLALGTWAVYATGGSGGPYTYAMLLPVLLASFAYGVAGGIGVGVIAPLLVGPWMPFDVGLAIHQTPEQWLVRGGAFLLVGTVTGALFSAQHHRQAIQRRTLRTDTTTGLPNREALEEDLGERLAGHSDRATLPGIALVRATDIGDVVDLLGLEGGDSVIRELAEQIGRALPELGGVYRFSDAELALILTIDENNSTRRVARRIHDAARGSLEVGGAPVRVEPALGVGHTGGDTEVGERELIRRARVALRRAILLDRSWISYEPEFESDHNHNVRLIAQAEAALEVGEFELHYQPKVRLSDHRLASLEALIRWRSPEGGLIPPGRFMPKLEQTSLIEPFSRFVIREAVDFARSVGTVPVALNLATRNLADSETIRYLLETLRITGTPSSLLQVEVTEGGLMREPETTIGLLQQLREHDVGVSIDDFGTGYSSFSYLRSIPATELKIDRSFVSPIVGDERLRRMVMSMIEVGHALGMEVTAEGVETEAQAAVLAELGCDLGQGFLWSAALPDGEIRRWMADPGAQEDSA